MKRCLATNFRAAATATYLLLTCFLSSAGASPHEAPFGDESLYLGIDDSTSTSEDDLATLKEVTAGILGRSGIKVYWINRESGDPDILVRLQDSRQPTGRHRLGWTNLHSSVVTIDHKRAKMVVSASSTGLSLGVILGHAAAHEIGHLLLATGDHSSFGIMKAAYGTLDFVNMAQGNLWFTQEQSQLMRSRLLAGFPSRTYCNELMAPCSR
jgi:hypothetical protein